MSPLQGFVPLFRRELTGLWRTWRLAVALGAALLTGLGSPVLAYAIPALIERIPPEDMKGMAILLLQKPGLTDALVQLQKNLGMMPILLALLGMSTVSADRGGMDVLIFTRPASPAAYLLSKAAAGALLAGMIAVVSGVCFVPGATLLFGPLVLPDYLALCGLNALLLLWAWCCMLIGAACNRGAPLAAAAGIGGTLGLGLLGLYPSVAAWTPAGLNLAAAALIQGEVVPHHGLPAVGSTLLGVALLLALAVRVTRRAGR